MTDIDAVCEAVVREKNEEIEWLTNLVRQTHREYVLTKAALVEMTEAAHHFSKQGPEIMKELSAKLAAERDRADQLAFDVSAAVLELAAARPIVDAAKARFRIQYCTCALSECGECHLRAAVKTALEAGG